MGREGVLKMGQDDQLHLQKFRHVVLLTMRPDTQAAQLERVMEELAQLPRQIEQIKSYNVGVDASIDKGNATVAVVADFASVEDYEIYRDHEAHKAVIKDHIKPILAPGGRTAIQHFPTQTHEAARAREFLAATLGKMALYSMIGGTCIGLGLGYLIFG